MATIVIITNMSPQSVCAKPSNASTRVFMGSGKPVQDKILPSSVGEDDLQVAVRRYVLDWKDTRALYTRLEAEPGQGPTGTVY